MIETVDTTRRCYASTSPTASATPAPLDAEACARAGATARTCALAAEMVGTARRLFDMALAYAKERKQFDVPIGSFQAIQHKLADMSLALERATAAVHYARDDRRRPTTPDRAHAPRTSAKAAAGEAARRILKDGIQIHGGIGYTWEHDLHLFLRRATVDEYLFGTTGWHHDRLADLLFAWRRSVPLRGVRRPARHRRRAHVVPGLKPTKSFGSTVTFVAPGLTEIAVAFGVPTSWLFVTVTSSQLPGTNTSGCFASITAGIGGARDQWCCR